MLDNELEVLKDHQDAVIIGGGLSVAILGGLLRQMQMLNGGVLQMLTLLVLLTAPVSIYYGKKVWGGAMERSMEILAIGLIFIIIDRIPQRVWLANNLKVYGLGIEFWAGFFNFLGAVGLVVVSYGFYRFWKVAQP